MSVQQMTKAGALLIAVLHFELLAAAQSSQSHVSTDPVQITAPLPGLPPPPKPSRPPKEVDIHRPPGKGSANLTDPVVQSSSPTPAAAQSITQWEGLGAAYPGFTVSAVPPDTNMAVGPNHIVEWVNGGMVIFNKQGSQVQAPVADSTFWGSQSPCYQGGGFSDPVVKYDRAADRWIVGEVALPLLPGLFGQYAQCFAVSKTSDPTYTADANGNNTSYYIWTYGFGANINDYDKLAVWSDGYYVTWNIFQNGSTFTGPEVCAWNRNDMVNGVAKPAFKCFQLSKAYDSLLPSDLEGATSPPAGSPNYLLAVDTASGALNLWKFHADFVTPANSTLTGPTSIPGVAAFTAPCTATQDCIPQPGTTQKLDALGDRLMYRVAYRNFPDHESLLANHTVLTPGGNTGVRWYEVRNPGGSPAIYQQGTFAPDSDNRWMASIGVDKSGNIGVGYSVSSGVTFPSIRYTGWQVADAPGSLEAETSLVEGAGSQTGYNRWGDYSLIQVDPGDDCTFWYTQEYQATTQSGNWNTRIGSFKFSTCGQAMAPTTTTLGASPNPTVYGQSVTLTATVAPVSGTGTPTGTVTFKDGATTLGSSPLNTGSATFPTSSLAVGSHSITAAYSGDAAFGGSTSSPSTQNVNQAATTTSVTSSVNPSVYGQAVKLTATVSAVSPGTGTPTGTVTFKDGAGTLGTGTLNASGQATLTTSGLSVASHSITAVYGGSAIFSGSTSAALTQSVNRAGTTTGLTSSPNPSTTGQIVTFTATVTAVSPGAGAPTGTVTFTDGVVTLGTGALNASGQATFSTSALALGTHSVSAAYGGDTSFNGSTSSTLTQTVNPAASGDFSITASPASRTISRGGTTTYTVTVTPSGGFSGTVAFSVSGLPGGATGKFNPTSVSGSGTSTLSVKTNRSTPLATSTLTIKGTSGSLSHAATVGLTVTP